MRYFKILYVQVLIGITLGFMRLAFSSRTAKLISDIHQYDPDIIAPVIFAVSCRIAGPEA
jgi:hypothetical protein